MTHGSEDVTFTVLAGRGDSLKQHQKLLGLFLSLNSRHLFYDRDENNEEEPETYEQLEDED